MRRFILSFTTFLFLNAAIAQNRVDTNTIGNTTVSFVQKCETAQNGISWLHVHENETTAVASVTYIIDSLGKGCFVTWKHSGDRYVSYTIGNKQYKFDPNRIYTPIGLEKTLKANGQFSKHGYKAAQKLAADFIRNYVDSNQLIVAMHNNSDGGGLHIRSYLPGGEYANDASEVNVNDSADIDDFFYTTDKRIFDYLKARGFNILLQNNATVTDDGSLSVYCGYNGMAYLNIEAEHGHLEAQKRMILAVFAMIDELFQ